MKENWTYKKLGEVCEIYQPKTISMEMLIPDGQYLVYGANGVIGRYDQYNHEESEVLLTCRGATCGSINVSEPYSWINGNAMVIHPLDDSMFCSRSFLVYLMRSIDYSMVITGAAQPQITRQKLSPVKIAIPPITEQEKILSELDLLQSIIDKQQAQLKELDKLAQAVFYDMFGDPVENEKGWEVKKLGDVFKINSGKFIDSTMIHEKSDGLFPCFGGNGLRGYVEIPSHHGDYPIIGRVGALCGNVHRAFGSFYATEHALVCTPKQTVSSVFACSLLQFINLFQYAKGVAQPVLSASSLSELRIIFPALSLQQSFASKIESIDKQKSAISQSIAGTQKLFDYTMDKYFG